MNYKTLASNPRRNTHHFFVDMVQGLQYLPKEVASTALVAATGETYICTNDKQWVLFKPKKSNNNNNTTPSDDSQTQGKIIQTDMGVVSIASTNLPSSFDFIGCEFYLLNDLHTPIFAKINNSDSNWYDIIIPQECVIKYYYIDNDPDRIGTFAFYTEDGNGNRLIHKWTEIDSDPIWKENDNWTYQCATMQLPEAFELFLWVESYNSETGQEN